MTKGQETWREKLTAINADKKKNKAEKQSGKQTRYIH